VFATGAALGGLLGGLVGDRLARWSPDHGRAAAAQFTVFSGLPLALLLLKGLPQDESVATAGVAGLYGAVFFLFGLCISWAAPACNSPMFAEIVPEHMRSTVYAFDRSFEGAIAACAAPVVGLIAERLFDFRGDLSEMGHLSPADDAVRHNARALGNALLVCLEVPWALCLVFYSLLHLTYRRDRLAAADAGAGEGGRHRRPGRAEHP